VGAGRFRRDLLYRLNGFTIYLPPLRERRDDLPLLIEHFIRLFGRGLQRNIRSVTPEAQRCLEEYEWRGNVRELQSVLKYAIIRSAGEVLTLDCLPENLRTTPSATPSTPAADAAALDVGLLTGNLLRAGETDIYRRVCLAVDRVVIETARREPGTDGPGPSRHGLQTVQC
jgi:two-component system nitrogen regulation response regulator GlnG